MRINGVGTTYLGYGPRDADGCRTATLWFTLFYLPVKALHRRRLRLHPPRGGGPQLEAIAETPLEPAELRRTRLYAFVLFPLLLLWPVPFAVAAIGPLQADDTPWWAGFAVAFTAVWVIAAAWKLADWHDARSRPPAPAQARARARRPS